MIYKLFNVNAYFKSVLTRFRGLISGIVNGIVDCTGVRAVVQLIETYAFVVIVRLLVRGRKGQEKISPRNSAANSTVLIPARENKSTFFI